MQAVTKVVFNSLGPGNTFHYNGLNYKDGMTAELPIDVALSAVQGKFAIPYTEDVEKQVEKKVSNDTKKRQQIAAKVELLKNEGGK